LDRAHGGLGLGLAIVKNLVEAHGGSVAARSDGPGQGSEFEVVLPAGDKPAAAAGKPADHPPRANGKRILVVDDNDDAAMLLAEPLERWGYVTGVAHDATEALAAIPELHPTVAILDLGLPVIDGYELARRIRELPGGTQIRLIALTGYGQPS